MRNFFGSGLLGMALAATLLVSTANAQSTCSDSNKAGLVSCIDFAIATCDSAVPTCTASYYGVSLEDVEDEAIQSCCGKNREKARKKCLKAKARRYKASRKTALFDFVKEAKKTINNLRSTDCYNNAYAQLF